MGVCWLQIHIWGINWQRISVADILLPIKCVSVAFFPQGASRAILATTGLVVGNWRLSWASLSACSAFHRYCKISNNHRPTLLASTHGQWSSSFVTRQILKSLTQWVVKAKTFTNPKLFFPSQQFMSRRLDCPNEKHLCKSCPTMWVIASPGNLWQSVSPCFYSPIMISLTNSKLFWRSLKIEEETKKQGVPQFVVYGSNVDCGANMKESGSSRAGSPLPSTPSWRNPAFLFLLQTTTFQLTFCLQIQRPLQI